ncbi:glycogen debranching N-terminal domain-containing protein [Luedemannella flava]
MPADQLSILDGSTFLVSDPDGEVHRDTDGPQGLFYRDVRHLSRWQLRLNGRQLNRLSSATTEYDTAVFYLAEATGSVYRSPPVTVVRHRRIGGGLHERLTVSNHRGSSVSLHLMIMFAADFADLFEVRDGNPSSRRPHISIGEGCVTLEYRREDFMRRTVIRADGAAVTEQSLLYQVDLEAGETWHTDITVELVADGRRLALKDSRQPNMNCSVQEWLESAPRLETDWADLNHAYRRSLLDLAALRFYPDVEPHHSVPAGGLPWYMALFGRDSLITSYQALPFVPELAHTTLRALAERQAHDTDDFRDAEPGKIMHELRHGELTRFHQRPQSPYYGSADATPLFLVVLDEDERWTGDASLVREMEGTARAALRWMEVYGDRDGDGFIEYATRNHDSGMVNHCWKDSDNSIVYPDGRPAPLPRAVCEIQGYAYDARLRLARLAREFWHDDALADRAEADAARLRERFNDVFWLPDDACYALALDGQGCAVPTVASNMGQLLWSGVVPPDRVDRLVGHLFSTRMFSGWGIRTMAAGQPAYSPVEYHNGAVWPHDNALIAAGLARYGRHDEAARIAQALVTASRTFDYRLPEALTGADRALRTFRSAIPRRPPRRPGLRAPRY